MSRNRKKTPKTLQSIRKHHMKAARGDRDGGWEGGAKGRLPGETGTDYLRARRGLRGRLLRETGRDSLRAKRGRWEGCQGRQGGILSGPRGGEGKAARGDS